MARERDHSAPQWRQPAGVGAPEPRRHQHGGGPPDDAGPLAEPRSRTGHVHSLSLLSSRKNIRIAPPPPRRDEAAGGGIGHRQQRVVTRSAKATVCWGRRPPAQSTATHSGERRNPLMMLQAQGRGRPSADRVGAPSGLGSKRRREHATRFRLESVLARHAEVLGGIMRQRNSAQTAHPRKFGPVDEIAVEVLLFPVSRRRSRPVRHPNYHGESPFKSAGASHAVGLARPAHLGPRPAEPPAGPARPRGKRQACTSTRAPSPGAPSLGARDPAGGRSTPDTLPRPVPGGHHMRRGGVGLERKRIALDRPPATSNVDVVGGSLAMDHPSFLRGRRGRTRDNRCRHSQGLRDAGSASSLWPAGSP